VLQDALQALLLLPVLRGRRHGFEATNLPHATGKSGMTLTFNQWQQHVRVEKAHPYSLKSTCCGRFHSLNGSGDSRRHREHGARPTHNFHVKRTARVSSGEAG
jgi:hypothetical protein